MIGTEENQEEVTFKVSDRRKFNADGSLKDGVVLEAPKPVETPPAEVSQPEETLETPSLEAPPAVEESDRKSVV